MLDPLELTGRRAATVEFEPPRCTLHRDAIELFLVTGGAALADGIDPCRTPVPRLLAVERQCAI